MKKLSIALIAGLFLTQSQPAFSLDLLNSLKSAAEQQLGGQTGSSGSVSGLSQDQIIQGLREALKVGTERVVAQIGQADGYLADPAIHIPLPDKLKTVQSLLQKVNMGGLADNVETRLNRAAEQAAAQTKSLIFKAIENMTLDDARQIYDGPKDAATQYFRKVASPDLKKLIDPIVEENLKDVGALSAYDTMMGQYKTLPFVPDVRADLIGHTTTLAMDGLFHYLAQEEAAIRENPAKRTSDILKTVFGN